jgi:hypothetical protein
MKLFSILFLLGLNVQGATFEELVPFMGSYYLVDGDKNCKLSFEVFIKKESWRETFVGFYDAFDVGFDPELEIINAGPYISDAGGYRDRSTTFTLKSDSYQVVDKFKRFTLQFSLKKILVDTDGIMNKYKVVITGVGGFGDKPFACEYKHFAPRR